VLISPPQPQERPLRTKRSRKSAAANLDDIENENGTNSHANDTATAAISTPAQANSSAAGASSTLPTLLPAASSPTQAQDQLTGSFRIASSAAMDIDDAGVTGDEKEEEEKKYKEKEEEEDDEEEE
jgi:hypothetical protein